MQTWNIGDTIAAKNSKAQVIAADGKGWVKVRHDGQEYEGYQVDFEAKGWRKRPKDAAVGCITLLVILVGFGGCTAMLAGNEPAPQPLTVAEKYQQNLMIHTDNPGFNPSSDVSTKSLLETFEQEKQETAQNLANRDGASSVEPYLEKLTQLGKSCYELEKAGYSQVEAVPHDIGGLALFTSKIASDKGIEISNFEVLLVLEQALQTNPDQDNCSNVLLLEMRKRYPQMWS